VIQRSLFGVIRSIYYGPAISHYAPGFLPASKCKAYISPTKLRGNRCRAGIGEETADSIPIASDRVLVWCADLDPIAAERVIGDMALVQRCRLRPSTALATWSRRMTASPWFPEILSKSVVRKSQPLVARFETRHLRSVLLANG